VAELNELKAFNYTDSSVVLWTFKVNGAANENPRYSARWVDTDDGVKSTLRSIASTQAAIIEETLEYSLTTQNNEGSALTLSTELTHAGLLMASAAEQPENRKIKKVAELQNSAFYAMKFIHEEQTVFAIRKTGSGWKTKRANDLRRVFYIDEKLSLDEQTPFEIEKTIDLFILNDTVFLRQKNRSESVLRYKQAHLDDFSSLQAEPEFAEIFSNLTALVAYIGKNKMQLRRAAAIRQKAHYKDEGFMDRLREEHENQKLKIAFDDTGKIIATEDNVADIMTALLDHRLSSVFSQSVYDVQDTQPVE